MNHLKSTRQSFMQSFMQSFILTFLLPFSFAVMFLAGGVVHGAEDPVPRSLKGHKPIAIAIHGGAGILSRDDIPQEREKLYLAKLDEALTAGYGILEKGGASLDAVETVIRILEDSPLFNAGKGAVFTADGVNELDASIMDGKTLNAGAVAGVKRIKNPITLARKVMEHSEHVMFTGAGAEVFASRMGIKTVEESYFRTQRRWESLQRAREKEKNKKFGTVGCVALDRSGNLAAGTSTGGMTNKKFGRIGDSPVIGAGTYADNRTCAVSCTGHGEYFIRTVVAHDISARMEYGGRSLATAAAQVLEKVKALGGSGGLIAVDHRGNITMPFTSTGMFRGSMRENGQKVVKIFKD